MPSRSAVWTHPSVRLFAPNREPVEAITEKAREVVAQAYDRGWSGPPFDPFALANMLQIRVVASHRVRDARIVAVNDQGFRIEYNPRRPRSRIRYSIAHEIAHTLFPDCSDQVRNRSHPEESDGESWELESLCNLAAAEFLMPVGSFSVLREGKLGIEQMLHLRRKFAVSMEAILLRTARLSDTGCMAFVASRVDSDLRSRRFRVDYCVPSAGWNASIPWSGMLLKESTRVAECTKIGYTAKGRERWDGWDEDHSLECVGLPPHPKSVFPRVAGIVRSLDQGKPEEKITYVRGDATRPRTRPALIVQVVNDATPNWGGNGFAVAVRQRWSHVQTSFRRFANERRLRLGSIHVTKAEPEVWIASMVAQKGYRPSVRPKIRYSALRSA